MKSTIYDVADLAGVSISTVSRILNDRGRVKAETKVKVLEAIKRLNYSPNLIAKGLAQNDIRTIGVVTSAFDLTRPDLGFRIELVRGIRAVLQDSGYSVLQISEPEDTIPGERYLQYIDNGQINGLIIANRFHNNVNLKYLISRNYPVVYLGERLEGDEAGVNVYGSFNEYLEFILDLYYRTGHRNIFLLTFSDQPKTELYFRYYEIFKRFCETRGMPYSPKQIVTINNPETLPSILRTIISKNRDSHPAFYTIASGEYIYWILYILQSLNLRVPEDVSLVCNEYYVSSNKNSLLSPPVSTISVPAFEMGSLIATLLLDTLRGNKLEAKEHTFGFEYIDKGSVADLTKR